MERLSIDRYILGTLMRDLVGHDKKPSAFLVYLFIWYRTAGAGERTARLSHQVIADETGLSRSSVQDAIRLLRRRKLIVAERENPNSMPDYSVNRPWAESARRSYAVQGK